MKKILVVVLCVVLAVAVVGCGGVSQEEYDKLLAENESLKGDTEGYVNADDSPAEPETLSTQEELGMIQYSVPQAWQKSDDGEGNMYFFPSGEKADGFVYVFYGDAGYSEEVTQELEDTFFDGVLESMENADGTTEFESQKASFPNDTAYSFTCTVDANGITYYTSGVTFLHGKYFYVFSALNPVDNEMSVLTATFPKIIDSITLVEPKDDFLKDDETRKKIKMLNEGLDFQGIIDLADTYIEANSQIGDSDSVHEILELAILAADAITNCEIVTDEFSGDRTVYYAGINNISGDTNIMPYIEDTSLMMKLGFKASDWIFFEDVKIKVGEDDYITRYFDSFDVARDVDNGISEIATTSTDPEEMFKIQNAESPVMRFTGKDEKSRDHQLTSEEISACGALGIIRDAYAKISDLHYQWERENGLA